MAQFFEPHVLLPGKASFTQTVLRLTTSLLTSNLQKETPDDRDLVPFCVSSNLCQ